MWLRDILVFLAISMNAIHRDYEGTPLMASTERSGFDDCISDSDILVGSFGCFLIIRHAWS